jgi:spermidine synthase
VNQNSAHARQPQILPWLLLLFVGSGGAALIYEIVWLQLLQLLIGSSAVSLGVLLGTFMGGMCLGSLALPRFVSARHHPLRVYALLELGIGALGLVVLLLVPLVARFYVAAAGHGLIGILLRGAASAICLLPPTLLMGATLPAMARWVEATPRGVSWLGFFYGGNIVGAVFGCLLAGFYLLRVHDMMTATVVAMGFNVTVAVAALWLAQRTHRGDTANERTPAASGGTRPRASSSSSELAASRTRTKDENEFEGPATSNSWPVYVTIALSGFCALGAEVIWTRLLSLMLGPTVYTFAIILAVFLAGLGIGSSLGSLVARSVAQPRFALGACQLLLTAAIAWTAWLIARSLPYWPINPELSKSPWLNFQLDLVRCTWAILPATLLWGASFPLALAAVASRAQDPGRLVGRVYAANTVGAIVGALGVSLLLIAWLGTQNAQRVLIGLSGAAALFMFVPLLWRSRQHQSFANVDGHPTDDSPKSEIRNPKSEVAARFLNPLANAVLLLIALSAAALLVWTVPKIPWGLIAFGRHLPIKDGTGTLLYAGEGMNASVAVTEISGALNFHVSGKIEASAERQDMRLQRMLGHLPALLHPEPRSVLIVGCGAGVTAGSFVPYPGVERIVICEIEPLIPRVVARHFAKENYDVVNDPRVRIVHDDARHFILTTREKFDIITSDPIHPWVKGAATLYTKEYFELVKRHLNPGGVVTQWVPLYESNLDVVKSEFATFFAAFPTGTVWSNDRDGEGYDVVLLGPAEPAKIDIDSMLKRLQRDERVAESLKDVAFRSVFSLLATYAGQGPDLQQWLARAEINRDRNLRLQYLAGLGLNLNLGGLIHDELLTYRGFPEELFVASAQHKQMLQYLIEGKETGR